MKKIVGFLMVIIFVIAILAIYKLFFNKDVKTVLELTEEEQFYLNDVRIFGNHMNIKGCANSVIDGETALILKNDAEEIIIDSDFNNDEGKTCFNTSDKNNEGINIDEIKEGKYLLIVKSTIEEEDSFYTIENTTDYKTLEYYTITKNSKNNKVDFKSDIDKDLNKSYIEFNIKETKLPSDVYDITIDPGHGGYDPGANYTFNGRTYNEADLTLKVSLLVKEELENLGLKVKLTREDDTGLYYYGENGRADVPNDTNSKFSISIHLNSDYGTMTYGGVEVYTPNDINYDLAKLFANNIGNIVGYSKKSTDKLYNGVYFSGFSKNDINESKNEALEKGNKPYDIKEGAPSMYMIREVGGLQTYAYVDGRNDDVGINKYYNAIQVAEPYLLEIAYINYDNDINKVINNTDEFAKAIASSMKEYLKIS